MPKASFEDLVVMKMMGSVYELLFLCILQCIKAVFNIVVEKYFSNFLKILIFNFVLN